MKWPWVERRQNVRWVGFLNGGGKFKKIIPKNLSCSIGAKPIDSTELPGLKIGGYDQIRFEPQVHIRVPKQP